MTNETYKGYAIIRRHKHWAAFDADGDLFEIGKTKHALRGFISAVINGDEWAINDLRKAGYHKI